jgi:hypothetical protein
VASSDNLRTLIQDVLSRFNGHTPGSEGGKTNEGEDCGKGFSISPEQALVIAGILGNVLKVDSVLIDRRQNVEILLTGTLKRRTQMDKLMDQIGSMPFDNVVKAFIERL